LCILDRTFPLLPIHSLQEISRLSPYRSSLSVFSLRIADGTRTLPRLHLLLSSLWEALLVPNLQRGTINLCPACLMTRFRSLESLAFFFLSGCDDWFFIRFARSVPPKTWRQFRTPLPWRRFWAFLLSRCARSCRRKLVIEYFSLRNPKCCIISS